MSARVDADGSVYGIHAQDTYHNCKKLDSPMDSDTRQFMIGRHLATWNHFDLVYKRFSPSEHGLRYAEVKRADRQSVRTVSVTSTVKLRRCLRLIRERPSDGEAPVRARRVSNAWALVRI